MSVSCCACLSRRTIQTNNHRTCRDHRYRHHGCSFRGSDGHWEPQSSTSTPTRLPLPLDWVSTLLGNVSLSIYPICAADADHAFGREPYVNEHHVDDLCRQTVPLSSSYGTPCRRIGSCLGTSATNLGGSSFASLLRRSNATFGRPRRLGRNRGGRN